jgi:hypothetical protein
MEKTLAEKAVENTKRRAERKQRAVQLRGSRAEILKLIAETKTASPEAGQLAEQWIGTVDFLGEEYVRNLMVRAAEGKTPHISVSSPEFLAFVLRDLIEDKVRELAERVVGNGGVSQATRMHQLAGLNEELAKINYELSALGEV